MPRTGKAAKRTIESATGVANNTVFEKESADTDPSVDILDSELATALGFTPTTDQFTNDFRVVRVPVTTDTADEAAATISIANVARNAGDDGYTVTFSAAPAATKRCKVRVVNA